jgi:hypothetical protein
MAGVFISYRHEDAPAHAARIYGRLAERYGKRCVFRAPEAIGISSDFRQRIQEAMGSCDALVAVIGRDWLTVKDDSGRPRLHDPRDWLRVEIATALRMNKVVIPVLVENARMPSEDDLPEPLKPLAYIHALYTSEPDWDHHVDVLIRTLEENTDLPTGCGDRSIVAYALMIAGLIARIIAGLDPIDPENKFVSWDLASVALVAVVLALLARGPRLRLVAAGMVVGAGIGTILRFAQSLTGSGLRFGEPLAGNNIDATLALYYLGVGSGLLLAVGGTVLYLTTQGERAQPRFGQAASASLLAFLAVSLVVVSIVVESDRLFTIRNTAWPAVMPVGLAAVSLVGSIAILSSRGFRAMGMGLLIVFGIQAIIRFLNDVGKAKAGAGIWIGVAGGVLLLIAGLVGSVKLRAPGE